MSQLVLQSFRYFIYVTAHSPTLPLLYLRHSSFSNPSLYLHHSSFCNPSVASPTSQLILQPFFLLSYVTGYSLTSPFEPTMRACEGDTFTFYGNIFNANLCDKATVYIKHVICTLLLAVHWLQQSPMKGRVSLFTSSCHGSSFMSSRPPKFD